MTGTQKPTRSGAATRSWNGVWVTNPAGVRLGALNHTTVGLRFVLYRLVLSFWWAAYWRCWCVRNWPCRAGHHSCPDLYNRSSPCTAR